MAKGLPGEFELIELLTRNLTLPSSVLKGPGDDCAILDVGGDILLLLTCDSQVEGVHFRFDISTPEEVGRKAMTVNQSDIAAMGGEPRYALVSLIIPEHIPLEMLERVYAGLREQAGRFSTAIIGGNIAGAGKGEQLIIDITLLGSVERGHVLTRDGAQVGDSVFVTGLPGEAVAGLFTYFHPDYDYPQAERDALRAVLRNPVPRVREGRILSQSGPHIVTSMLDISDGLSGDLRHICEQSHVGARIDIERLPITPAMQAVASAARANPLDWMLHGGDAYELLFTVAPGHEATVLQALQAEPQLPVTRIGSIIPASEGMLIHWPDGREEPLIPRSWDHFMSTE